LVVKSEPVLVNIEINDPPLANPTLYHSTVTEDGREVLELFPSDDEMEIDIPQAEIEFYKGMSSDTAVGDDDSGLEMDTLEGDNVAYSESMHGNDLFLPIPQIQMASPPSASPPAMLQSTDPEISNSKRLILTLLTSYPLNTAGNV
jgi:hypothetical protein